MTILYLSSEDKHVQTSSVSFVLSPLILTLDRQSLCFCGGPILFFFQLVIYGAAIRFDVRQSGRQLPFFLEGT